MSDKEIQSIVMRAENEYECMKDRIHDLYDENKELKKEIERLNNIINKAIEIYENRNSIEYKKKRFMEDKTIGYFMYEELKGVDKNEQEN